MTTSTLRNTLAVFWHQALSAVHFARATGSEDRIPVDDIGRGASAPDVLGFAGSLPRAELTAPPYGLARLG
jgi:hypothetical protein